MATRRDLPARYDHGAQFIKAGGAFQSYWQAELSSKPSYHLWFRDDVHRFAFKAGINILAKELAANFPIEFEKKVLTVQRTESGFHLSCEDQTEYLCDEIIMTSPLPQSLDILKKSGLTYDKELDQIHYAKALVALLHPKAQFEGLFANFKYVENATRNIFSISNQHSKQVSDVVALTVVANPDFSEDNFDQPDDQVLNEIKSQVSHFFSLPENAFEKEQLKKWRFSHPLKAFSQGFYKVQEGFYLAGDAFGGGSINGAVSSAQAVIAERKALGIE